MEYTLSPERMASEMVSSKPSLSSCCNAAGFVIRSAEEKIGTSLNDILSPGLYHVEVGCPNHTNQTALTHPPHMVQLLSFL
jgi:hypothetical protein